MIFNAVKKNNYEYIVIDDFYDDTELIEIKKEIDLLLKFKLSPEYTGAAKVEKKLVDKKFILQIIRMLIRKNRKFYRGNRLL